MKTTVAQTNEHQPVNTLLQLIAGIVILFLCVRSRLWKKLPSLFILFAALLFIICLASLINGDSLKRALEYSFATLLFCLLVEYGILSDIRHFLQAQMWFFGTLIVLNLITVLVFGMVCIFMSVTQNVGFWVLRVVILFTIWHFFSLL